MLREVTRADFIAELFEEEAAKMPASYKQQADTLLDAAKIYREFGSKRTIRVWEQHERERKKR
jgi:hypothetical protein